MENRSGILLLCWTIVVISSPAFGATNIYVGGVADGHDSFDCRVKVGYPVVNNAGGATNVSETNAWINGYLVSTGMAETSVLVGWDTTDKGTNLTWGNMHSFGLQPDGSPLTENATGLSAGTTYFYRFCASNALGHISWAPSTAVFSTDATPAINTGSGAAPISFTTATLAGNLYAGISANISMYWGQDTNNWSHTNNLGTRSESTFAIRITGLADGNTYHYRAYATNDSGEAWSDIVSFTTFSLLNGTPLFSGGTADGFDQSLACMVTERPRGSVFMIH